MKMNVNKKKLVIVRKILYNYHIIRLKEGANNYG